MGPAFRRAILGLAAMAAAAGTPALALDVGLDQTAILHLRAPAGDVLVGNAGVAEVTILSPTRVAVLGKGYGLTGLVVTDRMGRTIYDQQVSVSPTNAGRVTVERGALVSNFTCTPRCVRTPLPGEDKASSEPYAGAYKDYADRAAGSGGGATP